MHYSASCGVCSLFFFLIAPSLNACLGMSLLYTTGAEEKQDLAKLNHKMIRYMHAISLYSQFHSRFSAAVVFSRM